MSGIKKEMNFFIPTNCVGYKDYIRPSGIMDILQDIAGIHACELGCGYLDLLKRNLIWVVLYTRVDVIGELPKFSDIVKVETWPKAPTTLEHDREYRMSDLNNNVILTGLSKWVILDSNTHRVKRASEVNMGCKYYDSVIYNEKLPRRLNNSSDKYDKEIDYKIRLSDLDHNGHMNNARYLDMIYEVDVSNKKKIKSIEISFINEAHYNDTVHVCYYKNNEYDNYIGFVNNEPSFEARFKVEE